MKGDVQVKPVRGLVGEMEVPGDKSVSHRAAIFASMASGRSEVGNFLFSEDTLRTVEIMRGLGADISSHSRSLLITGVGEGGFREPESVLDCGNSGTTMRLMIGLLAAQDFFSVLSGDASLVKRPMGRVTVPLREMGAKMMGREDASFAPIAVRGGGLTGIKYDMPVSSAQVKSALLLAGMGAEGLTRVSDPGNSRDHTERMMRYFNIPVDEEEGYITVRRCGTFKGRDIDVVGDISSAAFFIVGALVTEKSDLTIKGVGMNPGRKGFIETLIKMGADITILNEREVSGEPAGDVRVKSSGLTGIEIGGDSIPGMIDEVPVLAVAAAYAEGETVITGAKELRVKESDRIKTTAENLTSLGVSVEELPDGLVVRPKGRVRGGEARSYGDHRAAMAAAVAGISSEAGVNISDAGCVSVSFPGFFEMLREVSI
ncbi:MAG: 3-phosphoshikimate 1-carboxyvinyltransferase [Deltaproteobacteria bacterium]|uniref:3-phosphoshikimate 1-carboxyvinyltransferase n=1 Tax=Candidatus Zymogenus saltonus TaxID=2844893 RepID=A0A9D8PNP1_9DELT|nr:3-phosphoshikimate 1-carboxyvinyltransferase [Candidatus Zymogenus saltonus]